MAAKYINKNIDIQGDDAKEVLWMQFGASLPILYSVIATIVLAFVFKENQWLSFFPQTFNLPKLLSAFRRN